MNRNFSSFLLTTVSGPLVAAKAVMMNTSYKSKNFPPYVSLYISPFLFTGRCEVFYNIFQSKRVFANNSPMLKNFCTLNVIKENRDNSSRMIKNSRSAAFRFSNLSIRKPLQTAVYRGFFGEIEHFKCPWSHRGNLREIFAKMFLFRNKCGIMSNGCMLFSVPVYIILSTEKRYIRPI